MSEIPLFPDECDHGNRFDACKTCQLEDSVFALTTVLRDVRKALPGPVPEHLVAEIDMLLGPASAHQGGDREEKRGQ